MMAKVEEHSRRIGSCHPRESGDLGVVSRGPRFRGDDRRFAGMTEVRHRRSNETRAAPVPRVGVKRPRLMGGTPGRVGARADAFPVCKPEDAMVRCRPIGGRPTHLGAVTNACL